MSSKDGPEHSRTRRPRNQLDEDDAITILNAVVDFRANHGGVCPTPSTMKPVYDAVKGNLHLDITFGQLYNKFRSLKHRYKNAHRSGRPTSPFDRLFLDLSLRAWGHHREEPSNKKIKEEEENGCAHQDDDVEEDDKDGDVEDASDCFRVLREQASKLWEKEGMPVPVLELGLRSMDKSKAATLEKKWRQHLEAGLKIEAKAIDVKKDFLTALSAAL